MNLTVLGLGADPRFFKDAEDRSLNSSTIEEPLPLTYREWHSSDFEGLLCIFDCLDLLDFLSFFLC
jgi:hypothetical protein